MGAAALLAVYLVWLLVGTGLYTAHAQRELRDGLTERIAAADANEDGRGLREARVAHLPGEAWAILKIPSIEVDVVVVEGVSPVDLKKGPGHYVETTYPWEGEGTVGIAGHRTTYGAPFWSLEKVQEGDRITLVTELGTFDYRVVRSAEVDPSAIEVLHQTRDPTLVLTTCTPRFSASQRLVVFANQIGRR